MWLLNTWKLQPGLQQINSFPLEDIQTVEVKKITGYIYGTAVERHQLWLVTDVSRRIAFGSENITAVLR